MHPDPPMVDLVHPLQWPGDLELVTQTRAACCSTSWQIGLSEAGATCCILLERPHEEETTLFGWSGLVCYHIQPDWNVSGFESYFISGAPGQDSP